MRSFGLWKIFMLAAALLVGGLDMRSVYAVEISSFGDLLWRTLDEEAYCESMGCLTFEFPEDQEVFFRLQADLARVVEQAGVRGVPEPELVVIHPDVYGTNNLWSASSRKDDNFSKVQNSHFFIQLSREMIRLPFEATDAPVAEKKGFLKVDFTGISYLPTFSMNSLVQVDPSDPSLPEGETGLSNQRIRDLFDAVYGDRYGFEFFNHKIRVTPKGGDYEVAEEEVNFWNTRGIIVDRKFNKILMVPYERPSEVPYNDLLIELMWELYAYYSYNFLGSARRSIFPDEDQIALRSDAVAASKSSDPFYAPRRQVLSVFRENPYNLKKDGLIIAPELLSLIYLVEVISHYSMVSVTGRTLPRELYFDSFEAQRFHRDFKQTKIWQHYMVEIEKQAKELESEKERRMHLYNSQQNGVFIQIIASYYESIPRYWAERLENELMEFYKDKSPPYKKIREDLGVDIMMVLSASSDILLSSTLMPDDVVERITRWLVDFEGRDFVYHLKQFSKLIEQLKVSANQLRAKMIEGKLYPSYEFFERDQTIARYLSLLNISPSVYEDFLLRDLSDIARARCLMTMAYEDNLKDYYYMGHYDLDADGALKRCGRVLNLRKTQNHLDS